MAVVCVAVILLLTAMSIFAPMVSKFDYREQHYSHTNAPMGTVCNESGAEGEGHVHYFGTDTLGRDIFTRIWMGGRVSLTIAVVSALVDLILGSIYGGISGYFGGTLDIIMNFLSEQSDYVTACCLGKRIVIMNGLKEVLRQQKAIGNNLNQLAVLANMGKVQFANLDSAVQEIAKINTALREMQEGGAVKSQSSIS